MCEHMHEHKESFKKKVERTFGWLMICLLFGLVCLLYGTLKEVRLHDDPYFASKIEKGQPFTWQGWEVTPRKVNGK